jgi:glycosyltransferase involved in cell wall biosynthesis
MNISYAITVCDELNELQRLVRVLLGHIRGLDEIVIQYDEPRSPKSVVDYLNELSGTRKCVSVVAFALQDDFAAFKNNMRKFCRGDYIFQIDADEYPSNDLLENLHQLLDANADADVLVVARVNTVTGLTPDHVRRWRWSINDQGWVNFPDPQARIYRNTDAICWVNRVHERLTGDRNRRHLPAVPQWALIHPKTIERQEKQNSFYERLAQNS